MYRQTGGELAGGHCVTLIGYDDVQGCWIGRNPWGAGWGDQGFSKIAYGECGIEDFQRGAGGAALSTRAGWGTPVLRGLACRW
ncbi:hypothetical protein E1258_10375 [Micromonospora sp. KC207]|nr:hypothetical protein E1258_10375 [Micromonospora sp. KC207]